MNPRHADTPTQATAETARAGVPKWLRILFPTLLILVWFAGAGIGGPYFGKVSEVSSNDPTAYLPESADATQVRKLLTEFSDSDTIPAIVVFTSEHELTDPHLDSIAAQLEQLPGSEGVLDGVSPALPSDDGKAVQAFVPIDSNADVSDAVGALGDSLRSAAPPGSLSTSRARRGLALTSQRHSQASTGCS